MGDKDVEPQTAMSSLRLKNDMGSEDVHYSIFHEDIPNDFEDVTLNETEENKRIGLSKLRDVLRGKDISCIDEHILITVLRSCKYDIEKSEKKLFKYLRIQDSVTKWLQTANLKTMENILIRRLVGILPYRDKHGRAILYTTPYGIDLELFDLEEVAYCSLCISLYLLSYALTTVAGIAYIAECKTSSVSIFYPIMKAYRHHILTYFNLPYRIAKVDVINENFIIKWSYNLLRPFMPSKLVQRVQFHGSDLQSLQYIYNPAILPEEFGGTMGHMNPKFFIDDFLRFIKKFKSRDLFFKQ